MRRHHGGGEQVNGGSFRALPLEVQPGCAHHDARLLVESAGEVENRGPGPERLTPVFAGQILGTAEEREVYVIEGVGSDGMDEGDLVAHLVQLALNLILVQQHEFGRRQGRLRQRFLQLPAYQGGGSGNGNLVHSHPCGSVQKIRND